MNETMELAKENVQKELGINTRVVQVDKNGRICWGLSLTNSQFSPIVYYENEGIEEYTRKAEKIFGADYPSPDLRCLADKDFILNNVRMCLQRKTTNDILKRDLLNLEMYVRLDVSSIMGENATDRSTVKMTKGLLTLSGLSETEIWDAAKENTLAMLDITNLDEVFGLPVDDGLFDILTCTDRMYGAVALAFPDTALKSYCHAKDLKRVYILPSSIHELLLIDPAKAFDLQAMANMVAEVNAAEVIEEEQLDPIVYAYDVISNTVSIAATAR